MTNGVVKGKDQLEQSVHQTSVPNFIAICAAVPSEMESRRKGMSNCAPYIGLSYSGGKKNIRTECARHGIYGEMELQTQYQLDTFCRMTKYFLFEFCLCSLTFASFIYGWNFSSNPIMLLSRYESMKRCKIERTQSENIEL